MTRSLHRLLWVLTPISAISGWYMALFLGIMALGYLDNFCPTEYIISDFCMAPWYSSATDTIIHLSAGLAALLGVLLPTLLTPAYRMRVAVIAYGLGVLAALWLGFGSSGFTLFSFVTSPVLIAMLSGLVTLWVLHRRLIIARS